MALPPSVTLEAEYTPFGSIVKVRLFQQTFVLCRKQAKECPRPVRAARRRPVTHMIQ